MQTENWHFPAWLWFAILGMFWWGLWGFLSKVGSVSASPLQMQILFTLGMLPVALGMLVQMRWKVDRNGGGIASVVAPVTGLFPVLTVALAFLVLRERLNGVQMCGMLLALVSIAILSV